MTGLTDEQLKKLSETFHDAQIEWRAQTVNPEAGWALMIPYITSRAVQSRLDDVCGPTKWKNTFREIKSHEPDDKGLMKEVVNMICGISILCVNEDSEEWVTKFDGAPPTDIEGFRGSLSGAMKRAAVSWGIGRFLYELEPEFVNITTQKDPKKERMNYKRVWYYYDKPKLPKWASDEKSVSNTEIQLAGFTATSWEDMLTQMKADSRVRDAVTKTGAMVLDGVQSWEDAGKPAQVICEQLVKYFEED